MEGEKAIGRVSADGFWQQAQAGRIEKGEVDKETAKTTIPG